METTLASKPDSQGLWLGKPAPRYTSYPPAPLFHTNITGKDYAQSLAGVPAHDPISLYIHIPFCRALCLYCGCNTAVTQRDERIERYIESIQREASAIAAIIGSRRISHLHFGGGTPNVVSTSGIIRLFKHLKSVFDLSSVNEIAMELDPRTVTQEQVNTLAACGVTRVSLGVQDFNAEVQNIVQRIQPYEMIVEICGWLHAAGINNINFDLIYGLPKQTPESILETARQVETLSPARIALFSYAHVPSFKKHQAALENFGLPDTHQKLAMEKAARNALVEQGYLEIGMDHFALPDDSMTVAWRNKTLRRNFQGYTDDDATTLVGLGASSISQTPDGFFQNERDERPYMELINAGHFATRRGYFLSREDRVRAAIIEQLMCYLSCDIEAVCSAHDYSLKEFDTALAALKPYEEAGLVSQQGHTLTILTPHRMATRVMCMLFDAHTSLLAAPSSQAA